MTAVHLFLTRHGRTAWNHEGRFQGHTDIPLDDVGRSQALALAEVVQGRIDALVTSDLTRASQSARIVSETLGLPILHVDADLRERGFGIFEGLTRAECIERYPAEWAAREGIRNFEVQGAERPDDVVVRMRRGLERAVASFRAQGVPRGLIMSHGSALRMFLESISAQPEPAFGNLEFREVLHDGREFVRVQ